MKIILKEYKNKYLTSNKTRTLQNVANLSYGKISVVYVS